MAALKKARLYDPEHYQNGLDVQFNPNTLRCTGGSDVGPGEDQREERMGKTRPAQGDPTGQTGLTCLSAQLFFHTYRSETDYQDVRPQVNAIRAFLRRSHGGEGVVSPRIAFAWGPFLLVGTLEQVDVTYQMFASDGTPVQAEVGISILGEEADVKAAGIDQARSEGAEKQAAGVISSLLHWLFS